MSVNLSALAGAGFQFSDANGNPLAGGKLFSYEAGTTTPAVTYTSSTGLTAHPNPIIFDSAGRVPTGEIWLTAGINYKFTLTSSTDILIGTYDNISGINDVLASDITYVPAGTGAVATTVQGKLRESVSVKDFGAVGDGVTDDTVNIQKALDAGLGPVHFPAGVYIVSSEIVVPDMSGIIGVNPFWKRRTGYVYDGAKQTVFKYTGSGGANSCVVRLSNKAVGVEGSDFAAPVTDDLESYIARDFHIDSNGLAHYGCYVYRAGNQSNLGNITAEKSLKYNHVHMGCYAAVFGVFGAYECVEHGVAIGYDVFSWGSVESTCFEYSATFLTVNNGTASTYVAGSATDLDDSGGIFVLGRGSVVRITSESNKGRACRLGQYNSSSATMGPVNYELPYIEGNADGPYIDYRNASDGLVVEKGFMHPGNPATTLLPQNIKIDGLNNAGVPLTDAGPSRSEEWLVLRELSGDLFGVGVEINSNTNKYKMERCGPYFTFASKRPGAFSVNLSLAGSVTAGVNGYSSRIGFVTKIGNVVTVNGRIALTSLDAATSGSMQITGLPYRIANLSQNFGCCSSITYNALNTALVAINGTLTGNNSYIDLKKLTAASTSNITGLSSTDLTATSLIQFSATYITDD